MLKAHINCSAGTRGSRNDAGWVDSPNGWGSLMDLLRAPAEHARY